MTTAFGLKASPGQRSQFHFTLSKDMAMKNEPSLSGPQMTILVADDNLASRELMRELLEAAGHRVVKVTNGH
jgi:PleD family two-component response regulator